MLRPVIMYLGFIIASHIISCQKNDGSVVLAESSSEKISAVIKTLEARVHQEAQKDSIGSISCAVVIGNELIWEKGFGILDKEHTAQVSSETIYMIGSISKGITAMALMRLVEKNIVRLDESVEKYVPEINKLGSIQGSVQNITFRNLATHTAGLVREPELQNSNKGPLEDWENKLLTAIPTVKMKTKPGEKFNYSNIGYGILGLAMCRAANKSFNDILNEEVFIPLQMKNSTLILSMEKQKDLARNYGGTRAYELGRGYKFPNGGVFSTAQDMANLIMAILDTDFHGYLSEASRDQLFKIQTYDYDNEDEEAGYGIGFNIWTDKKSHKLAMHGGIVAPGYSASLNCDLKTKIGIIMLRNDFGNPDIMELADEFLWELNKVM